MKYFLAFFFSISLLLAAAQTSQAEYLEAKRQFGLGNYSAAKLGFQSLTSDQVFGSYASFYFALSAYKSGDTKLAYDMWRQVQRNFPKWDQRQEVNYWLSRASFDMGVHQDGFNYYETLPADMQEHIALVCIDGLTYAQLESAYSENSDSKTIASFLFNSILSLPYSERDFELLSRLSSKFDLKASEFTIEEVRKSKYAIAVLLPFMFEKLENPQSVLRNEIIWNLYEGMKMGQIDLSKENIELDLFPFDTRRKGEETKKLLNNSNLEKADVIVGPLYSGPNGIISDFAGDNQIPMINPLSSNSKIIGDNPFSYLFMPSYETQGKMAAQYAASNFEDNKYVFVFYETSRDSLLAKTYLDEIEKNGFLAVRFERMTNKSAQQVQKDFIEKYEVRLDVDYTAKQMDSIRLLPGRIVKSRPLRGKNSGNLILDDKGNPITEYYEERFAVAEDSIGHILVASSSNLLANNFISLAEVRNDTIGIIGYEDWLHFPTISYNQLERLEIAFIHPTLFNTSTYYYEQLEKAFIDTLGREPGKYHLIGYEMIYHLGHLLNKNGKYFQQDISGKVQKGKVMYGLKYGAFHDNQVVPITQLEELKLINQNNEE